MNTAKLRTKRVLIPTIAAVAVLSIGGAVWATTANADDLEGGKRDRVGAAATQAVGGGKVLKAESSDDAGEAYEVEIRLEDGSEVDVTLDEKLDVVGKDYDDDRDDSNDANDANDTPDADDRALSATERTSAEKAAKDAVGGGTIVDVDASDDRGVAYEVEVRKADNTEWNVDLDADFRVVRKAIDN